MKISVITVCKNSSQTIEQTIESVVSQSHEDVEHIFCDGGSDDNTVELIKAKAGSNSTLIQGTDKGIYDAINKGIAQATGDVIAILNSDDFYCSKDVLEKVSKSFVNGTEAVYGDLVYVKPENTDKVVRYWKTGDFKANKFRWGWTLPHPTLFLKKSVYDKYGLYNDSYKIAGDYDLILRLFYKARIETKYIPEVLVKMRTGGASNGSLSKKVKVHNEDVLAWKNNDIKPNPLTLWLKPLRKMGQYIFHKTH
jgi:glycosyltransferase involved in cell wall biosynthesis